MCATESWPVDALYRLLTQSAPYHGLAREQFDLVVEMLAGRYAGSRVRELKPRLAFDRIKQTLKTQKGAVLAPIQLRRHHSRPRLLQAAARRQRAQ